MSRSLLCRHFVEESFATIKFIKLVSQVKLMQRPDIPLVSGESRSDSLPQISKLKEEVKYLKQILHVKSQGGGISELVYRLRALQNENQSLKSQLNKHTLQSSDHSIKENSGLEQLKGLKTSASRTEPSEAYLLPRDSRDYFDRSEKTITQEASKVSLRTKFDKIFGSEQLRPSIFAMADKRQPSRPVQKIPFKPHPKLHPIERLEPNSGSLRVSRFAGSDDEMETNARPRASSPPVRVSKWVFEDSVEPLPVNSADGTILESPSLPPKRSPSDDRKLVLRRDEDLDLDDDKATVKNHTSDSKIPVSRTVEASPGHVRQMSRSFQASKPAITEFDQVVRKQSSQMISNSHSERRAFEDRNSPRNQESGFWKLKPRKFDPVESENLQKKQQLLKLVTRLNQIEADISSDVSRQFYSKKNSPGMGHSEPLLRNNFINKSTPSLQTGYPPSAAYFPSQNKRISVESEESHNFPAHGSASRSKLSAAGPNAVLEGRPQAHQKDQQRLPIAGFPNVDWEISSGGSKPRFTVNHQHRSVQNESLLDQVDLNLKKIRYEMSKLRQESSN